MPASGQTKRILLLAIGLSMPLYIGITWFALQQLEGPMASQLATTMIGLAGAVLVVAGYQAVSGTATTPIIGLLLLDGGAVAGVVASVLSADPAWVAALALSALIAVAMLWRQADS